MCAGGCSIDIYHDRSWCAAMNAVRANFSPQFHGIGVLFVLEVTYRVPACNLTTNQINHSFHVVSMIVCKIQETFTALAYSIQINK